jgi:hypothetical protein
MNSSSFCGGDNAIYGRWREAEAGLGSLNCGRSYSVGPELHRSNDVQNKSKEDS